MSPCGNLLAFQGRFGYIYLMSARSKEWIGSLKMNGEAQSLTFNPDGSRLYSHGGKHARVQTRYRTRDSMEFIRACELPSYCWNNGLCFSELGEVYVWDINTRRCVHKFVDDGCIAGTCIAMSPTRQYLACGSSSGVVNVYSTNHLEGNVAPKPEKGI